MTDAPTTPARLSRRRRRFAVLAALAIGLTGVLVAPASYGDPAPQAAQSPSKAPQTGTAPTFSAPYLNGVSGPQPARTVSLDGQWGFTPIKDTVCTGGGPFGSTT